MKKLHYNRERALKPHSIVKDILNDCGDNLTRSERSVVSVLLTDYPVAGLQSITQLADEAGVSTPTIVRLARKLGFDGFTELQEALRSELSAQIKKPASKHEPLIDDGASQHIINQFAEAVSTNLRHSLERLDKTVFDQVAELLSDHKRSVYLAGGRITRSNADYFYNHLQIIRPQVSILSHSANVWPQYILDMNASSVLVIFDIRRYEKDLAKLARLANERQATIVLFTDQWGSPISKLTRYCFNAMVEVPSNWDSTITLNFIVESLIAEIQRNSWESSRERMEELESMFGKTKQFRNFS